MTKKEYSAHDQVYNDLQTEEGRVRLLDMMQTIDPNFSQGLLAFQKHIGALTKSFEPFAKNFEPLAKSFAVFAKGFEPLTKSLELFAKNSERLAKSFEPLAKYFQPLKSWLNSDVGQAYIKGIKYRLDELEGAQKEAREIKEILENGTLSDLVEIKPMSGLTFICVTGHFTEDLYKVQQEYKAIIQLNEEIKKRNAEGGTRKGENAAEDRKLIKEWYEEGEKKGFWKNRAKAIQMLSKWKESCKILEKFDFDQGQKLKGPSRIAPNNSRIIELEEEPENIIEARNLVEKMSCMDNHPEKTWTKNAVDTALRGIRRPK